MYDKAIVGLGNPGSKYELTRHNAGFMVVDNLVEELGGSWQSARWQGSMARIDLTGARVAVGKPATYMNLSGRFVSSMTRYFKVAPEDVLAVYDDVDLPLGALRLARGGGTAGHKGVASIIEELGTREFPRLRFGVGRPAGAGDVSGYVLGRFSDAELAIVSEVVESALDAVRTWTAEGIEAAMNRHNRADSC